MYGNGGHAGVAGKMGTDMWNSLLAIIGDRTSSVKECAVIRPDSDPLHVLIHCTQRTCSNLFLVGYQASSTQASCSEGKHHS